MRKIAKKLIVLAAVLCMALAAMPVSAATNKTIATKTFTNVGTVGSFYSSCTNYYWYGTPGKGYRGAKLTFNSTFKKNLQNFCHNSGSAKKGVFSIMEYTPSSVSLYDSDNLKLGWESKACCKSTKAVVKLIDTNGDKNADKAVISVYAYGKSTSKGNYGTLVGSKTFKMYVH